MLKELPLDKLPEKKHIWNWLNLGQTVFATVTESQFKDIESIVPQYTARPLPKKISYDENNCYNFLIFDTETNTTGKSAEICKLSLTDQYGLHQFSKYILSTQDTDYFASKVNELKIVAISGERRLYKNNKEVNALPLMEVKAQFFGFVAQSIERARTNTNKTVITVIIGHNASRFDMPILLRNFGSEFAERLRTIHKICFADSLLLFKTLIKNQTPCLQNTDGSFPQTNQFSLYNFLFNNNFDAHDALEGILALRKILFYQNSN